MISITHHPWVKVHYGVWSVASYRWEHPGYRDFSGPSRDSMGKNGKEMPRRSQIIQIKLSSDSIQFWSSRSSFGPILSGLNIFESALADGCRKQRGAKVTLAFTYMTSNHPVGLRWSKAKGATLLNLSWLMVIWHAWRATTICHSMYKHVGKCSMQPLSINA